MINRIHMFAALFIALPVCAQIRSDPELSVQKGDPHFAVLEDHQVQIKDRYDKENLILPSFGNWYRVESESAAQLFPKLSFYSISWSESFHPDAKQKERPIKKITDAMWHLGFSSYDQTISTTDKTKTVVTRTHYVQVMLDSESKRICSWEYKVDTSNERILLME